MSIPVNSLLKLLIITLSLSLTACGGGGGTGPNQAQADLSELVVSNSSPIQIREGVFDYTVVTNHQNGTVRITPTATAASTGANITVNGVVVPSGMTGEQIPIPDTGSKTITIVINHPNTATKTYTVNVSRLTTSIFQPDQTRLLADTSVNNDKFATQVALSGNTLAIGVPHTTPTDQQPGSVYIFVRDPANNSWIKQARIFASNAENGDRFGTSVSLAGNTLVVGAPLEDSKANFGEGFGEDDIFDIFDTDGITVIGTGSGNIGAAYVFTRDTATSTWTERAYLKPSIDIKNYNRNILFGSQVAISGNTIAVASVFEKSSLRGVHQFPLIVDPLEPRVIKSGAVYVFTGNGANWTQQAYIKASNPGADDRFSSSLALQGDTLVIGAPREDSNATGINSDELNNSAIDAGAVYVYKRNGATWTQNAYLKASNTQADARFGNSVTIDGNTLIAGAFRESSNAVSVNGDQNNEYAPRSGAAYVFTQPGNSWQQQAYLKSANTQSGGSFGASVSLAANRLAVGASGEDFGKGAVNIFTRTGASSPWILHDTILMDNPRARYLFGNSVALSDDGKLLAMGALEDSSGGQSKAGAAYIIRQ
ncbi:MAG: cadherin-like beta sandwich domain-containing protein [Gammaproteobacteria bacterium]